MRKLSIHEMHSCVGGKAKKIVAATKVNKKVVPEAAAVAIATTPTATTATQVRLITGIRLKRP